MMFHNATYSYPAGSVLGIIGGGQLGRMCAIEAANMGYKTLIWDPAIDAPAADVAHKHIAKAYNDPEALQDFIALSHVALVEFENIPLTIIEDIEKYIWVAPGAKALKIAQARINEKEFFHNLHIPTAICHNVNNGICISASTINYPAIMKTNRFGYDGKGQYRLYKEQDYNDAMKQEHMRDAIIEEVVNFSCEISVIMFRNRLGDVVYLPPTQNIHKEGILSTSYAPYTQGPVPINSATIDMACLYTKNIIDSLNIYGVLCAEFFVGYDEQLYINEIAPRPHNSGHWSQNGSSHSQFNLAVRAAFNLPLNKPKLLHSIRMDNLLGDDTEQWLEILQNPDAILHLYGKHETRKGRKMGHANIMLA